MIFSPSVLLVPIIFILTVVFAVLVLRGPKKVEYSKLDRTGIITNIVLSILYFSMSLIGVFSVFAADNPPGGAAGVAIENLIYVGLSLPIISIICIVLSVRFRETGHSVVSFVLQFIPLTIFSIMV